MKYKWPCIICAAGIVGYFALKQPVQDVADLALIPPPLPPSRLAVVRTNRPPPKPYTNIFLIWTNYSPYSFFSIYSRTALNSGQWILRTNYCPSLIGELQIKFTNNMNMDFFLILWTNLIYQKGGEVESVKY